MMRSGTTFGLALVALTGCQDVINLDPVDERPVIQPRSRPGPIIGGTLLVEAGLAVAADPDRDLIHVVDLENRRVLHTITLEPGDQPGRVVRGSEHEVHVVLRGFGGLATIDDQEGTLLRRQQLCPEPRGVAYDDAEASIYVTCAGGALIELDESGNELSRTKVEPDLRDVVLVDGKPVMSKFREATLVDEERARTTVPQQGEFQARVAWRTWTVPNDPSNAIYMLHQLSSTNPVPIDPPPEEMGPEDGDLPYGGGGSFCEPGISTTAVTRFETGFVSTTILPNARLTVDAAVSRYRHVYSLAFARAEARA